MGFIFLALQTFSLPSCARLGKGTAALVVVAGLVVGGCAGGGAGGTGAVGVQERAGEMFGLPTRREVSDEELAANAKVREQLRREINIIVGEQLDFKITVGYIAQAAGVKMVVDWQEVEAAGVERGAAVTVNLRKVSAEKALRDMFQEVGEGRVVLGYTIEGGVVRISTREDLESERFQVVHVFDVRDFLTRGGKRGLPAGEERAGDATVVRELMERIERGVSPESWEDKGGKAGAMRARDGRLVVKQTEEHMEAVGALLEQLRARGDG